MKWDKLSDDHWVYLNSEGGIVGSCKRAGGSWECVFCEEVVCWRPDEHSAKRAVEYLWKEGTTTVACQ